MLVTFCIKHIIEINTNTEHGKIPNTGGARHGKHRTREALGTAGTEHGKYRAREAPNTGGTGHGKHRKRKAPGTGSTGNVRHGSHKLFLKVLGGGAADLLTGQLKINKKTLS